MKETQILKMLNPRGMKDNPIETRMTTLETRFNTILPTLATKEELKRLERELTTTIHHEINSCT